MLMKKIMRCLIKVFKKKDDEVTKKNKNKNNDKK